MRPETLHLMQTGFIALLIVTYAYMSFVAIDQSFLVPVYFFGWYVWASGPGPRFIPWGIFQRRDAVSLRFTVCEFIVEGVLTKNKIPLRVSVAMTIRVDPTKIRALVVRVGDHDYIDAVISLAETAAVWVIKNDEYDEIMSNQDLFSKQVKERLESLIEGWGVLIENIEAQNIEVTDKNIADAFTREVVAKALADAENILVEGITPIAAKMNMTVREYRMAILPLQMDGHGNVFYPTDAFKLPQLERQGAQDASAPGSAAETPTGTASKS